MAHELPYFYRTEVEWCGDKEATLQSQELPPIHVVPPPEFEGEAGMWTPEHLFVGSINSCFVMTFLAVARLSNLDFASFSSAAVGKLERTERGNFQITQVVLKPALVLRHSNDLERAGRLLEKAERNCLISRSIITAVKLEPEINFESSEMFVG
ncbi:MAG TPA: OsmC family protein [Blastocatellia bacterium]|nr:OsmC family protein [Blastocatellia bacterium]